MTPLLNKLAIEQATKDYLNGKNSNPYKPMSPMGIAYKITMEKLMKAHNEGLFVPTKTKV